MTGDVVTYTRGDRGTCYGWGWGFGICAPSGRGTARGTATAGADAAETETVVEHATAKRARKGVDWIVANDVSGDVFGGDANAVHLVTAAGVESWDRQSKTQVADQLADRITSALMP